MSVIAKSLKIEEKENLNDKTKNFYQDGLKDTQLNVPLVILVLRGELCK